MKKFHSGCAALAAFVLFCACTFAYTHVDHDCPGEDCPVCAAMAAARDAAAALCAAALFLLFYLLRRAGKPRYVSVFCSAPTLTGLKVRLNA